MAKQNKHLKRIAVLSIDEVLPHVFTREIRRSLVENGFDHNSQEWKDKASHRFEIDDGVSAKSVKISMGSHRYQLFAKKGVKCVNCGAEASYFAVERYEGNASNKFHLNLYGKRRNGDEFMLTKDHVMPKSRGGPSRIENYQVMCKACNNKKSDKV